MFVFVLGRRSRSKRRLRERNDGLVRCEIRSVVYDAGIT
jgi:hypothetical protein